MSDNLETVLKSELLPRDFTHCISKSTVRLNLASNDVLVQMKNSLCIFFKTGIAVLNGQT